jgi:apolipoprotein D and lipocalin family protein
MSTYPSVLWKKYLGHWQEQARIPSWFEPATMGNSTADYRMRSDGKIIVLNQSRDALGTPFTAKGIARIVDSHTLAVSFFPGTEGSYIVLGLLRDTQGEYVASVVGSRQKTLWILTRGTSMSSNVWMWATAIAKQMGYPVEKLQRTPMY